MIVRENCCNHYEDDVMFEIDIKDTELRTDIVDWYLKNFDNWHSIDIKVYSLTPLTFERDITNEFEKILNSFLVNNE